MVGPEHYPDVRRALVGTELRPFHLVIAGSLEYLVDEVLASFAYKRRPKKKSRLELAMQMETTPGPEVLDEQQAPPAAKDSVTHASSSGLDDVAAERLSSSYVLLCEERTFLCEVPLLRDAHTVCQSTTEVLAAQSEAHYSSRRGVNPRRCTPGDSAV